MRKLHLVGFTSDRKGLIFSARRGSKSGGFLVPLEDALLESLAAEQRRRNGVDTESPAGAEASAEAGQPAQPQRSGRPQSTLTPREMQSRLRAGRTIAEVAAEAGVSTDWVERFAIPILAEQAQIVELARSLTYVRARGGESALPLGASVAENLAERGVFLPDDMFDAAWSAYQLHDVIWVVRIRYRSRGRVQEAAWQFDVSSGHLTGRNRLASELAYVEKGRRRRARLPVPSPATEVEPASAPRATARARTAKKAARATSRASSSKPGAIGGATAAPSPDVESRSAATPGAAARRRPRSGGAARTASSSRSGAAKSPGAKSTSPRAAARRPRAAAPEVASSAPAAPARATARRASRPPATRPPAKRAAATRAPVKRPAAKRTSGTRSAAKRATVKRPAAKRAGPTAPAAPATASRASIPGPAPATTSPAPPVRRASRRAVSAATAVASEARSSEGAEAGVVAPRRKVGTDGSPRPPSSGRGVSRRPAPLETLQGEAATPDDETLFRAPVNRLAASRVVAGRTAAGRLRGDRRAANPVPPPEAAPSRRTPDQLATGPARPTTGGRAATAGAIPAPPSASAFAMPPAPSPAREASAPAASRPAASPPAASAPGASTVLPSAPAPEAQKPSAGEGGPRSGFDSDFDPDFEIDDLLEPPQADGEPLPRPVIAAARAGRAGAAPRPLRRPASSGPLSPWPVGTG